MSILSILQICRPKTKPTFLTTSSDIEGLTKLFFVLTIGCFCSNVSAQKRLIDSQAKHADTTIYFLTNHRPDSIRITSEATHQFTVKSDFDTILIQYPICKNILVLRYRIVERPTTFKEALQVSVPIASEPFLKITGTIQYDYLYRSYVDTPFAQHDYQQHSLQASLNIKLRNKYPLRLNFSTQQNNSPYFRNLANLNLQFDPHAYLLGAKQRVLNKLETMKYDAPELRLSEAALKAELEKYNALKARLSAQDLLQRLVEEREKNYYAAERKKNNQSAVNLPFNANRLAGNLPDTSLPSYNALALSHIDSLVHSNDYSNITDSIVGWKRQADSLQKRLATLQHKTDSLKAIAGKNWNYVRQKIYAAKKHEELQNIERENGLALEKPSKLERMLTNIRTIGIGRSLLDYSELTAWNVLLTGLNVEYNAKNYVALAAGKIDYGYRDFFGGNRSGKGQNFLMGRLGFGNRESKAVIFSVFTGRKFSYGSKGVDSLSNYTNITGYSVEGILKKENHYISLEIAKTTKPFSGNYSDNHAIKGLSDFNDMTNIGMSIKAQTVVKASDTRLSGFYRKTGENFQSFSLFTYNVDQTAWNIRVDQPFLKNKISLTTMLRRNDFVNPFTDKVFKTNTIFKSFQATVRVPKYPALSVGYYPGSQVYIIDKQRASENVYYILNGSLVHTYPIGDIRMVSALMFNQYSNKGTDSGFIAYKGVNYTASQSMDIDRLQLQGLYAYTDQEELRYSTLEGNADYSLSKILGVGGGIKYNKIIMGTPFWGSRFYLSAEIKPLGRLRVQYEKSYLPTLQKTLFPIETGRISWLQNL